MRAQDNTEGVARPIVVRLLLWLACTFRWKYEVNVSHADLGGSPQRQNTLAHHAISTMPVSTAIPFGRVCQEKPG